MLAAIFHSITASVEGVNRAGALRAGHQSLLVRLPKTGALLLSGDAVHFRSNWENRGVPQINFDKDQTAASMQRIAEIMAKEKAQLWINHDKAQSDSLKIAPGFYD